MKRKLKIGFYSHTIDYAGTWRSHERIAEILQHDPSYEVYIFYSDVDTHNRLEFAMNILRNCKFIKFNRSLQKQGPEAGYSPVEFDIHRVVKDINIDIFHFARSGYFEWPFTSRMCPIQIETNIFGYKDYSQFIDGSIIISKSLGISESKNKRIISNPIPAPKISLSENLRNDLGISNSEIVFGRIGRPDNFTPIALEAYKRFVNQHQIESKYIIIAPCQLAKDYVVSNGLSTKVLMLESTNDDVLIEKFNNTIDIFAHYRSDGETFGTAIAQAMIHGKPVITHFAGQNGQLEIIGNGGFCVNSVDDYYKCMVYLSDKSNLKEIADNAKKIAIENYEQNLVVTRIKNFYNEIIEQKGLT